MAGSGTAHLRPDDPEHDVKKLLTVEGLDVSYGVAGGRTLTAVDNVSFDLMEGETLGLVGESGCGKSSAARAVLQLPKPTAGRVHLEVNGIQTDLTQLDAEQMRQVRPQLQMIHQDPISSLNPRRSVRDIVAEPLVVWWEEEEGRCVTSDWFEQFGQISKRVWEVMARIARWFVIPAWVAIILWVISEAIEDRSLEDTLAWTQLPAQVIGFPVLAVLVTLGAGVLLMAIAWLLLALMVPFGLISRQFGEINKFVGLLALAGTCAASIFLLIRTLDSFSGWPQWLNSITLLLFSVLLVSWLVVSLFNPANAGAAGVAAALAALMVIEVFFVAGLDGGIKLLVFVGSAIVDVAIGMFVARRYGRERQAVRERAEPQVREALETVGVNPDTTLDRKPNSLSGGQAQRVSIARALVLEPKVIVCDEPVSALDVSVQAQILNLLEEMKQRLGLTLVFIAHDLAVVKNVSDRVVVMYLGKLCEIGPPDEIFTNPTHPYTELLIGAIPHPDPSALSEQVHMGEHDEMPSVLDPPSGCRFRTRCRYVLPVCSEQEPEIREVAPGHFAACHAPLEITKKPSMNGSA